MATYLASSFALSGRWLLYIALQLIHIYRLDKGNKMNEHTVKLIIESKITQLNMIINEVNRENYRTAAEVKRAMYDSMAILAKQLEELDNE